MGAGLAVTGTALLAAAAEAPAAPGVYFFLDGAGSLLYIGKATNIRARLRQHRARQFSTVAEVRWEVAPDADAAAVREADLIVALRPPMNRAIARGKWNYIRLCEDREAMRFELTTEPRARGGRVYGCFPHLGKGVASVPGTRCSDGYCALLRLLWASGRPEGAMPRAITSGSPPPVAQLRVDPDAVAALHPFLSGTSALLLHQLGAVPAPAFMEPGLRRDRAAAAAFYEYGPRALRRLRLRHGRPARPMSRQVIEALLASEVRSRLGEFRVGQPAPPDDFGTATFRRRM